MQPRFVVPEQSRGGFILDLTPRHKALPVQALDLQRAEQCLAAGIDAQQTRLPLWRFILLTDLTQQPVLLAYAHEKF
jgi:hypothetical protein